MKKEIQDSKIIEDIRNLLISSRQNLQQTVNTVMVQTYWHIGRNQDAVSLKLSWTHLKERNNILENKE